MKYPKLREILEAGKAIVKGPYTSSFPDEPHVPVSAFRGQPRFDADACVGCLACEQVCPSGAIEHFDVTEEPRPRRVLLHHADRCIFCGQCEAACIADPKGIRLTGEWELSFFERNGASQRIEKELQLCEVCGAVVACVDHLESIARRLGARSFSSPSLYLTHLRKLGAIESRPHVAARGSSRSDRFQILCARCRRRTTLAEGQS